MNSSALFLFLLPVVPLFAQAPDDGAAKPFEKLVPGLQACTTFAPDGKTVYFVTLRGEARTTTIMQSPRVDGHWGPAAVAPFSALDSNGDPAISPDGSRLFFWSRRPAAGKPKDARVPDLWWVDRQGNAWSEAHQVPGTLRTGGPSVAADGTLYFFRVADDKVPRTRLVRSRAVEGGSGAIEDLGETINGAFGGFDPAIAPDQSFLVFASKRPDSAGESDLYISHRHADGWTEPRNLGSKVNSKGGEFCPSVSADGNLYFTRGEEGVFYVPLAGLLGKQARDTLHRCESIMRAISFLPATPTSCPTTAPFSKRSRVG